jgi:folate-binding protein YgfZ
MTAESAGDDTTAGSVVFLIESRGSAADEAATLERGAAICQIADAVIAVTGPGAKQCLQGLLTCDLEQPGAAALQYGALLTAKAMVVSDMWIAHIARGLALYVPPQGKAPLLDTFQRSLPPRLARFTENTARAVLRLVGPGASDVLTQAGLPVPAAGRIVEHDDCVVALAPGGRPFVAQIDCPAERAQQLEEQLAAAGALISERALGLARILAGWPALGAEIDDKTLPQEARLDELGGVSHTKGCYLGQETVARIHFRGHVNKRVVGLAFGAKPESESLTVTHQERTVGRLTSAGWFGAERGYLGLALLRREVVAGEEVTAGGVTAKVAQLPFEPTA